MPFLGTLALIAASGIHCGKRVDVLVYKRCCKKINSGALMADAWHHRSDALSSIGAFVGILGGKTGIPDPGPDRSIVICVYDRQASIDIFRMPLLRW